MENLRQRLGIRRLRGQVGRFTFILALGFAIGLMLTMVKFAWYELAGKQGWIGFLGFGIPMILTEAVTAGLWSHNRNLEKTLGWSCTFYSMIKFFVLDVLLRQVVAVSSDPAPDSAFAPPFFGRPSGQLPWSQCTMSCMARQATIVHPFLALVHP